MPQNYECLRNFGGYRAGSVVPEWVVERAGPVAEHVRRGIVAPTHKPVSVDLRVPEPKAAPDVTPAAADELNRLRAESGRLAADNKTLMAQVAALRDNLAARDKQLGRHTEEVEHLRAAAEDHQTARDRVEAENAALKAKVAELTAELEAATAPRPKQSKQAKQPEPAA